MMGRWALVMLMVLLPVQSMASIPDARMAETRFPSQEYKSAARLYRSVKSVS